MKLKNRTAVVTGAAGNGMGRSIALLLAEEGANVIINYSKSKSEAENIADYINQNGGSAYPVKADVFVQDECNFLIDKTIEQFKTADILIIGPGAGWNGEPPDALNAGNSLQDINNEVAPVYYFLPKILPIMQAQQWGRIIGISSLTEPPTPSYSYNVAKKARTNALLLAAGTAWENNITINAVAPGPVAHIEEFSCAVNLKNKTDEWINRKNITPHDIAETILFLCSEEARFVSGNEIRLKWK